MLFDSAAVELNIAERTPLALVTPDESGEKLLPAPAALSVTAAFGMTLLSASRAVTVSTLVPLPATMLASLAPIEESEEEITPGVTTST